MDSDDTQDADAMAAATNNIQEDSHSRGVEQRDQVHIIVQGDSGQHHVPETINPLRAQDPPEPQVESGGQFNMLILQLQAQREAQESQEQTFLQLQAQMAQMREAQESQRKAQEQIMKTIMDLKEETEKNARIERERQAAATREAETQRIIAIEQARQQAEADAEKLRASERECDVTITAQPAPVTDLQLLADISSSSPTDEFSAVFSPVLDDKVEAEAEKQRASQREQSDVATTIQQLEPVIDFEQPDDTLSWSPFGKFVGNPGSPVARHLFAKRALLMESKAGAQRERTSDSGGEVVEQEQQAVPFSTNWPSLEIFPEDSCVLQQCYGEKKHFTPSPARVSNEPFEPVRVLQPCHAATTTAVHLNAEHFKVVCASRVWDPGGPFSFYRAPRRDDDRTTMRGEIDTSLSGFFLPCQQAWERWEQQGRGTTHSE